MVTRPSHFRCQASRSAQWAQWILYLALSTSIGLVWIGLYVLVASTFGDGSFFALIEQVLVLFLGTSFLVGLSYRLWALGVERLPSLWFSLVIPGIGAMFTVAIEAHRTSLDFPDLVMALIAALGVTYICGGIVLIPLSIAHMKALQGLHLKLNEWATRASVRSLRHVAYGVACAGLLIATEVPRYWSIKAHRHAQAVAGYFGATLPPNASLLDSLQGTDPDTDARLDEVHFRIPGGMAWPPSSEAVKMTRRENERDVRLRFFRTNDRLAYEDAKFDQVKWYEVGGWVQASRFRTADADYLELRRHFY